MSIEALTTKYISSAEKVLAEIKRKHETIKINKETIDDVVNWAVDYLKDAKYYKVHGKLETSLTSIAYCEGLLDALRLIGAVEFEWPIKQQETEK